jgi:hypothetical protein
VQDGDGARRLFVTRHINVALMVEVRDLSDRDAAVAMGASTSPGRKVKPRALDVVVKDSHGAPPFRIRRQINTLPMLLPLEKISESALGSGRGG